MFISKFDRIYRNIIKEAYDFDPAKERKAKLEAGTKAIDKIIEKLSNLAAREDIEDYIKERCQDSLNRFEGVQNSIAENGLEALDDDSALSDINFAIEAIDVPGSYNGPAASAIHEIFDIVNNDAFLNGLSGITGSEDDYKPWPHEMDPNYDPDLDDEG